MGVVPIGSNGDGGHVAQAGRGWLWRTTISGYGQYGVALAFEPYPTIVEAGDKVDRLEKEIARLNKHVNRLDTIAAKRKP